MISTPRMKSVYLLLKLFYQKYLENEVIETEDEEIILINDIEVLTPENDPEAVTVVKDEVKCNTTSEGDKIIAKGKEVLKSIPKTKESGKRSWFSFD